MNSSANAAGTHNVGPSADLHLHTIHSDGTFTPSRVVAEAKACGLACIALTDHDTVNGVAEAAARAKDAGIEFIPGIELTAHVDERELHLLGYFPASEGWNDPKFRVEVKRFSDVRIQRVHAIVAKLNDIGVGLRAMDVFAVSGQGTPGRLHVARALLNGGFVESVEDAFDRFLKNGGPGFAPKFRLGAPDAIELIHRFGGVAVFAHPGLAGLDRRLGDFAWWGLDGIEVWHTKHRARDASRYQRLAEQYGLLQTGGSDCHGMARDEALIGGVRLSYAHVEKLKAYAKSPPERKGSKRD